MDLHQTPNLDKITQKSAEPEFCNYLYRGNTEINHQKICRIDPRLLEKGYTNMSRAAISGHANFTNWRAAYGTSQRSPDGRWVIQLRDGSKRFYG